LVIVDEQSEGEFLRIYYESFAAGLNFAVAQSKFSVQLSNLDLSEMWFGITGQSYLVASD